jgi:hypothetical protein
MTDKNTLAVRRVIGILTAISVLAAAIILISCCLSIYFGEGEYSREIVIAKVYPLSAAILLCPVFALIGIVFELFLPAKPEKLAPDMTKTKLARLSAQKAPTPEISRERKARRARSAILIAVLILCSALFLAYALNPSLYGADILASVTSGLTLLICFLSVCFCLAAVFEILDEKSIKRELLLLESAEKRNGSEDKAKKKQDYTPAIRISLLIIALFLLVYGYIIGGTADVLTKAVNICTECIGLG